MQFLFKNNIMSTCLGFNRHLLAETISPAFEKSRSEGTEVAGIAKYFLARMLSLRYC